MSNADNPYATFGMTVAQAPADTRATFIRKTYLHLTAAVYAFAALEWALFKIVPDETLQGLMGWVFSGWNYLIFMGAFIGVSWLANSWARSGASKGMQYAGLSLYVVAQALFFLPLLYVANGYAMEIPALGVGKVGIIGVAAVITLVMFGGLTGFVFLTRKDFSFLGYALGMAGFAAMGFIACSMIFGFSLGMVFSVVMIVFACGYILYDTSNVLHHYREDQYVAAALALFASVILLFWYVLRLLMAFSSRD